MANEELEKLQIELAWANDELEKAKREIAYLEGRVEETELENLRLRKAIRAMKESPEA